MQFPFPPPGIPSPAVLNWKDKSVSFMPCPLPGTTAFSPPTIQKLNNESSTNSITPFFPGNESKIIQNFLPVSNQMCGNGSNQGQISNFLLNQPASNNISVFKAFPSPKIQMLNNEPSTNSVTPHLLGNGSRIFQGLLPPANQPFANEPNQSQNSDLFLPKIHLPSSNKTDATTAFQPPTYQMFVNKSNAATYFQHRPLSSEDAEMTQDFYSVTVQLSSKESNISQQFCSLSDQLPLNEIRQDFNMFNKRLSASLSHVRYPPPNVSSFSEFVRNREKNPREFTTRPCSESHSKYIFGTPHNQYTSNQQSVRNQPLSAIPKMGFHAFQGTSLSDMNSHQSLYPQYSENVHICVIGPPLCGKADLIRTFGRSDQILTPTNKPFDRVSQHVIVEFGTTLKIDIWYANELIPAADDLRHLCQTTKSVIVLVYSVAQKSTLLTVLEWIKILKSDIAFNVPIMLIANTAAFDSPYTSKEFSETAPNRVPSHDGVQAKKLYNLAAFYELSDKCDQDVDAIFLIAAHDALHRTIQKSIWVR